MEKIITIYENNDLLAINKPAGLVVHSDGKTGEPTLADWIIKNHPEIVGVGEDPLRPGIVHRLDKDTSGVLIIAKNQQAFDFFKKQFQERETKKEYVALVDGHLPKDWGIIDKPIGKSKKDFRKRATRGGLHGKVREAVTEYKILEKFDKYDLVQVFPKTGRTHQIRVHFTALSHPVAGDKLYGFAGSVAPQGLTRHFLHAKSLEITTPEGKKLKIEAEMPKDLEAVLKGLRAK